jgi:hypothetical protein
VRLTEETLADEVQRENQRYIDDVDVHAPSVITVNMVAVGWAVNDFMQYAVGLGRPRSGYRILRTQPVTPGGPQLVSQTPDADPDCRVCGLASYSVLSKGDGADLPTRMR